MAVCAAVLLDAVSTALTGVNPKAALALNPLNSNARVLVAAAALESPAGADSAGLEQMLARAMLVSPADARFASLAGILLEREGNRDGAARHYAHALSIAPTEIQALTRLFNFAIQEGRRGEAASHAEKIARRWPRVWPAVEPFLADLVSDKAVLNQMADAFSNDEVLRDRLVTSLSANAESRAAAFAVVMRWHANDIKGIGAHINMVTSRLMDAQDYSSANLLFRLTRTETEKAEAGFVFNGSFSLPPSGNPFDWQFGNIAGVSITIDATPARTSNLLRENGTQGENMPEGAPSSSLVFRFLDSPVQLTNPVQYIRLAPARYMLKLRYSTDELRLPKPLQLAVTCTPSGARIAEIEIDESDAPLVLKSAQAVVPPQGCQLQHLGFSTQTLPGSWKNRYFGTLAVHDVSLEFLGG